MHRIPWLLVAMLLVAAPLQAQQVSLEGGAYVENLWVFPSASDPNAWYYIPQSARLAQDENGEPVFSFLRYVKNAPSDAGSTKGITDAEGGGIVTLMATYDTPPEVVKKAQRAIKQASENEEAILRGPVIFTEGRYVLVSSVLADEGEDGRRVLATGNAPVFEGNEVAFSFDIDPQSSKLLLESFKMTTPDVSIMFEMTFTGLTDAYQADLIVNWDEVQKHETMGGGVSALSGMINADVSKTLDELRKNNAIQLVTRGANDSSEALLDKAMTKILDLMFKKVPPPKPKQGPSDAGLGMIAGVMAASGNPLVKQAATGDARGSAMYLGASFHYEKKELKKSGTTTMSLNHQEPADRYVTMVANIGDLYRRYGEDGNRFRTVNIGSPAYQQREVHVGIDGAILPEFDKYINSVTVTMRKRHENGAQTLEEVVVDRNTFNQESRDFRMIYGWNGDADRDAWLQYDYRTRWSFKGGGLLETDWTTTETNMIDLFAPYRRSTVELVGNAELLKEQDVRAVSVLVEYDFFDGRRSREVALRTNDEIDGKEIEITLPLDTDDYDYTITWIRRGKPPAVVSGNDDSGVIFFDEVPADLEAEAASG